MGGGLARGGSPIRNSQVMMGILTVSVMAGLLITGSSTGLADFKWDLPAADPRPTDELPTPV